MTMRRSWAGLMLLVVLLAGCATGPFARSRNTPSMAGPQAPSSQQLLAHLNHEARRVQSVEFLDVDIQAKQGIKSFGVRAMLAYQKPRNFRLMAEALNATQADVGSNDQEFWFMFKDGQGALYRCSYEDYPRVKSLPMPIHPDWVAEALALHEFGPAEQYAVRTVGDRMELTCRATGPQGQTLHKTTAVAMSGANAGRIVAQHLRTPEGKEIWSAEITEYHSPQRTGGYLVPRKINLRCPNEKMELAFKLDGVKVNALPAGANLETFRRPRGYQEIDLARGPNATPSAIQRVRGSSP